MREEVAMIYGAVKSCRASRGKAQHVAATAGEQRWPKDMLSWRMPPARLPHLPSSRRRCRLYPLPAASRDILRRMRTVTPLQERERTRSLRAVYVAHTFALPLCLPIPLRS
jgi:hypothetical protein